MSDTTVTDAASAEADRIDAEVAADDTVSFSREGYERRRPTWDDSDMSHVAGKTVVVTGATNGLGLAAATDLAALGAHVVIVGRDPERTPAVADRIAAETGNDQVEWVLCDLASLASVRAAAAELLTRLPRIDVLLNIAGHMVDDRQESVDGYELTWATNMIGPYLLTELLLDRLAESAPARLIEMTSGGAYSQRIDLGDLDGTREEYEPKAVYSRTKRAQIIVTEVRAEQLADRGVVCHVTHPGWAVTPGLMNSASMATFVNRFGDVLRTASQGADTAVWLASADEPARSSGLFWHDRRPRETHRVEATRETQAERDELIATLRRVTGLEG
ncbi:SDR family NAD(P)-dependent oxidoreductase [Nocardioides sp.]|uniref:SDR family NAD(P)-dependent oxidoreductase n=1 Tax=Nocardioides sp. TaxID=35761 RepID=UPI0039E59636